MCMGGRGNLVVELETVWEIGSCQTPSGILIPGMY